MAACHRPAKPAAVSPHPPQGAHSHPGRFPSRVVWRGCLPPAIKYRLDTSRAVALHRPLPAAATRWLQCSLPPKMMCCQRERAVPANRCMRRRPMCRKQCTGCRPCVRHPACWARAAISIACQSIRLYPKRSPPPVWTPRRSPSARSPYRRNAADPSLRAPSFCPAPA